MPGYFSDRQKALIVTQNMKDSDFDFEMGNLIWYDIQNNYMNAAEGIPKFDKPVLILHGRQDPLGELVAVTLSNYYKNSKLEFIEKTGHYSWIEQPENVFSSIDEFLSKH